MTRAGTQNNLMRKIFNMIPADGIYEHDLLIKLAGYYSETAITGAMDYLLERKFIKRAGCKDRPIYVRMEPRRVVFTNIKALPTGAENILLQMHSNFQESP